MELVKGRRLHDRFQVIGSLGSDGYGRILLARDSRKKDEPIALKIIRQEHISQERLADFQERVSLLASIDHAHLNAPTELVNEQGFCAVLREYFEGEDLASVLLQAQLPYERLVSILRDVLSGLTTLHSCGLNHGHLTPGNILIGPAGVRLTGLEGSLSFDEDAEGRSLKTGSAYFYPPEYLKEGMSDTLGDIYSFGLLCNELLGDLNDSSALKAFVAKATQRDPRQRFQDLTHTRTGFENALIRAGWEGTLRTTGFFLVFAAFMLTVLVSLYVVAIKLSPHFDISSAYEDITKNTKKTPVSSN